MLCLILFLVNTHIGMLDLFKKKIQDLSSHLGNLLSLKRGLFIFLFIFILFKKKKLGGVNQ